MDKGSDTHPLLTNIPPAEEEIVVDAMPTIGAAAVTYVDPAVILIILEPEGCEFLPVDEHLRPNDMVWDFPKADDNRIIRASINTHEPQILNRGNSKSFRFAIKGRADRDIKMGIMVTAQPLSVEADSCRWIIEGLGLDSVNLGGPLDELPGIIDLLTQPFTLNHTIMDNLIVTVDDAKGVAIKGENTSPVRNLSAGGVLGRSNTCVGVQGLSISGRGVVAISDTDYGLRAVSRTLSAIRASSVEGTGVEGEVTGDRNDGSGVRGTNKNGKGVHGMSVNWQGVYGESQANAGVVGESTNFHGVWGESHSSNNGGVIGINNAGGWGVIGRSPLNVGVSGESENGRGVVGTSKNNDGVFGSGKNGVSAFGSHTGVFAKGPVNAGFFEGNVFVTKTLTVKEDIALVNADCAEDFDISGPDKVEPGTVMVLGEEGALLASQQAYDKRVAGVISGAGDFKPGIVLDKQAGGNRQPVALLGKVFCKVDAQFGAIEVGDLLTTSPTPGHAMRTDDPFKAFGAVIGKALRSFTDGQGLIPILIALQ